jgi:hypothetical protein
MKYALMAALLITLPAVIAFFYALISGNHLLMWAALASLSLNTLPFIAAGLLMRKSSGADLGH